MNTFAVGTIVRSNNTFTYLGKEKNIVVPFGTVGSIQYYIEGSYGICWVIGQSWYVIEVNETEFTVLRHVD